MRDSQHAAARFVLTDKVRSANILIEMERGKHAPRQLPTGINIPIRLVARQATQAMRPSHTMVEELLKEHPQLSREVIAAGLRVSPTTVRHWLNGKRRMPVLMWGRLHRLVEQRQASA